MTKDESSEDRVRDPHHLITINSSFEVTYTNFFLEVNFDMMSIFTYRAQQQRTSRVTLPEIMGNSVETINEKFAGCALATPPRRSMIRTQPRRTLTCQVPTKKFRLANI